MNNKVFLRYGSRQVITPAEGEDASSVLDQLSKDIQALDNSIKKKENNNSDSNK
jgi:predicted ATPase